MFSVVIPYYKKRKYIERCLDSVLKQTCQSFEIILVDDGSDDDISDLISIKYIDKVKLIQQENQGVSVARNTGIGVAKNDFIAFLDADDYWSVFYLEKVSEVIKKENNIKIIGSRYSREKDKLEVHNSKLDYFLIKNYFHTALRCSYFFTSATVLHRGFFKNNSGFNPLLKSGEDLDVWFRAVLSGDNAFYINNILVYYSDEDENQATLTSINTANLNSRFITNMMSIYYEKGNKIYPEYFYDFLSKYLYSNLYLMFFRPETNTVAQQIKKSIPTKYFWAEVYYFMPFLIGNLVLRNKKTRKLSRIYFKFLFSFIYKK